MDYAASTPIDKRVKAAMDPYFSKVFGNPGALHWFGQEASAAIFKAREAIAESLGANYKEITFTGSATEANNLAIRGVIKAVRRSGRNKPMRIITSEIEHESVLEICRDLEKDGIEIILIPVSQEGIIDLKKLKAALNENTVLVSVMYANNEIGTIQPIQEIAKIISEFRKQKVKNKNVENSKFPLFHTDAVQAFQYLNCKPEKLGVDLMTLSAHKICGPKGIGALYANEKKTGGLITAVTSGGGQERGLRSGTENTAYIVGFTKAIELADQTRDSETNRVKNLRDYLLRGLKKIFASRRTKITVNGSLKNRLPNNLNVYFSGHNAADLLIKLDLAGVAVSPGAACSARLARPSYVLEAMGFSDARCSGSLRISLGRQTTMQDIDKTLKIMLKIV